MSAVVTVGRCDYDDPDAVTLRGAQRADIAARYGTDQSEPGTPPSAADIAVFVIARDAGGAALGCGGLRDLGDGCGEVKRMYVVPAARGTGVATLILQVLEGAARDDLGWHTLRLETGDRQPEAIRFYEREGFLRVPCWGAYAGSSLSHCYGKTLG